ncbi:MAG TPA: AI-2E family transporter [Candidatus Sulfotelmatobacter sp.]|nr:AI-2E family transporter [Candidatus Sulfotelmatobacter sp.]
MKTEGANESVLQNPETPDSQQPEIVAAVEQAAEEVEVLQASIKIGTVAQIVIALIAMIGLLYLLKLVLVTILVSILLAYILEPAVALLVRWRLPRWLGAGVVVSLAVVLALGVVYFSYNRAVDFANEMPRYTATLRRSVNNFRSRADRLANQARSVVEPPKDREMPVPVRIDQQQGIVQMISENSGTILDILMAVGFVPFLVYFMLASKEHVYVSTVRLFPKEHRLVAHRTVGNISNMIRSFLLANLAVGLMSGIISAVVFWQLGIQYFYFIGAISGFVTLIPYLGMFLALLPPLAGGAGILHHGGTITVIVTVIGIHAITMNLIYPRVVGARLKLNALAVSLSLLFWAWIWGAPGLILAIPIVGALKIICDHMEPLRAFGFWLGD